MYPSKLPVETVESKNKHTIALGFGVYFRDKHLQNIFKINIHTKKCSVALIKLFHPIKT